MNSSHEFSIFPLLFDCLLCPLHSVTLSDGHTPRMTNEFHVGPLLAISGPAAFEHGAIVEVQNSNNWTPLHEATFHNHPDII